MGLKPHHGTVCRQFTATACGGKDIQKWNDRRLLQEVSHAWRCLLTGPLPEARLLVLRYQIDHASPESGLSYEENRR